MFTILLLGESEDIATCDDARKDPEENLSGNSASNSVGSNSSVVMHQKSDISSQGTRQPTVPMSSKSSENDDSNSSDDNDEEENDDGESVANFSKYKSRHLECFL